MNNISKEVIPVLLGGDLNAYSMAIAFAEAYGCKSYCFARERLAVCDLSLFIELNVVPGLDDCNVAVPALIEFAKSHKNDKLILIPCADWYVEMLEYARDRLSAYYFFHIPDFKIWRAVTDKASFIKLLDKYGIPRPKTEVFESQMKNLDVRCKNMRPPFVVKPSDSSLYWRNRFEGMKKVYFAHSLDEAGKIGEKIFSSGYTGKILVQEKIGARDIESEPIASVVTVYLGSDSKVKRAVLGDVLLEEKGITSRGNYSAIVTRPLDSISKKLLTLLEEIGYTGVANIDILTSAEGSYCLELNARQGRSFDYLRISGVNLAKLFVQEMLGEKTETDLAYRDALWRSVRWRTVEKHTKNKALLKRAYRLERGGRSGTPYNFKSDKSPGRRFYVMVHLHREAKRYKTYS